MPTAATQKSSLPFKGRRRPEITLSVNSAEYGPEAGERPLNA